MAQGRRRVTLLAAGVLLALGACAGGDGDGDGDGSAVEESPAVEGELPEELPGADETTADGDGGAACAEAAEAATPGQALASFPDNPDTIWAAEDPTTTDDGLVLVTAVPDTADVGYPAFRFTYACTDDGPVLLGAYAAEGAGWSLLFTTDAPGAGDLPPTQE